MAYKERGKIIAKLPVQSGTSGTGKGWSKVEFVIETQEQYAKKLALTLFGDKANLISNLKENDLVDVSFSAESREHNGRWFHNLNCFAVDAVVGESSDSGLSGLRADDMNLGGADYDDGSLPF